MNTVFDISGKATHRICEGGYAYMLTPEQAHVEEVRKFMEDNRGPDGVCRRNPRGVLNAARRVERKEVS